MQVQAAHILWNHMKNWNYYVCWVLRGPRIENVSKQVTLGPSNFVSCYIYTSSSGNLLLLTINIVIHFLSFFSLMNRFKTFVWINTELNASEHLLKEMF